MSNRTLVLILLAFLVFTRAGRAQSTREITYNPRSVAHIDTRVRMTTLIVLPEGEEILDFVCGDKDFWVVSGAQNLAYVKPAKSGATTNLNLVTASGRVYSFLLAETSNEPDLKVFVTLDPHDAAAAKPAPRPSSIEVEALKREVAEARAEVERVKKDSDEAKRTSAKDAQQAIDKFKAAYPLQLHFPYVFKAHSKPFRVSAIFHDDRFTYIRLESRELPAVYEVIDHAPNLVSFQADHNTLIVPKILENGYLTIGKQRLEFSAAKQ